METGPPSFEPYLSARRFLKKRGLTAEVSALDAVVAGGVWTNGRFSIEAKKICRRCNLGACESLEHRFYFCPGIREILDPLGFIVSTEWAAERVRGGHWDEHVCLYARAIVPASLAWFSEPAPQPALQEHERAILGSEPGTAIDEAKGVLYSDGSGGQQNLPKCLRKAGAGAAFIGFRPQPQAKKNARKSHTG